MQSVNDRLDRMIEIAVTENYTLDSVVAALGRCDQSVFDAVSDSASRLPKYIKSKLRPYR